MSNLAAIGLIGALLIAATFFLYYVAVTANRIDAEVVSGFVQGVPVPRRFRWWTLLNVELPTAFLSVGFSAVMTLVFLQIGLNLDDEGVALLANACAIFFLAFTALYLVVGVVALINVISGRAKRAIYRTSPSAEAD